MLSIGTGEAEETIGKDKKSDYTKIDSIGMTSKFLTTFEQIAANKILERSLGRSGTPGTYVRL